jgi:hypothetical protein
MITRALALVALAALAAGCSDTPTVVPGVASKLTLPSTLSREGAAELAARGDFAAAAAHYAELVRHHPDDVPLRFAYGTVLSHLDRYTETIREFTWVVDHGDPAGREVRLAREWLGSAAKGRGPEPQSPTVAASSVEAPKATFPPALLRGQTSWPGIDPAVRRIKLLISVEGDDDATRGVRLPIRIDLGRPYRVSGVPAGAYRLVGSVGEIVLWDERVVLDAGRETVLDLGPARAVTQHKFPPSFPG